MSLQVWLPLNGDLHNQGLLPLTRELQTQSATNIFTEPGKIGGMALSYSENVTTYFRDTTNNNDSTENNVATDNKTESITQKTGDLTGDSKIDSADLLYLRKYLLGKITFTNEQKKCADTNKDGNIDSADLLNVRKYLLGKIKNF